MTQLQLPASNFSYLPTYRMPLMLPNLCMSVTQADVETDDLDLAEDLDEEEEQEDSAPTAGIQISGTTSTNRDGARGDRGTRTGGTNGK